MEKRDSTVMMVTFSISPYYYFEPISAFRWGFFLLSYHPRNPEKVSKSRNAMSHILSFVTFFVAGLGQLFWYYLLEEAFNVSAVFNPLDMHCIPWHQCFLRTRNWKHNEFHMSTLFHIHSNSHYSYGAVRVAAGNGNNEEWICLDSEMTLELHAVEIDNKSALKNSKTRFIKVNLESVFFDMLFPLVSSYLQESLVEVWLIG